MYKIEYPEGKPLRKEWLDRNGRIQSRRRKKRAFDEMRHLEAIHQLKQIGALENYEEYAAIVQMVRNEFNV